MNGYSEVPTRGGIEGAIDKLVLVETSAEASAHDRPFAEFVLRTVSGAGNGADKQAAAWCRYVEKLQYVRERGEVLRDPKETVGVNGPAAGGDCDDLVLALLAGCKTLEIPCKAEILCSPDGWGFHIRALIGLPPLRPTVWAVVDPVWQSEREWAMQGKDAKQSQVALHSQWLLPPAKTLRGQEQQPSSMPTLLMFLLVALGLGWLFRQDKSPLSM